MTLKPRVKIYRDENGQPKGDGSICYAKNTSVGLALQVTTIIIRRAVGLWISEWLFLTIATLLVRCAFLYHGSFSKVLDGSQLRVNVVLKVGLLF